MKTSYLPPYLDSLKKEECYGCLACIQVCGTNALSEIKDEEGFSYPILDTEKCVKCGKCRKVCPYTHQDIENNTNRKQDVYYAWSNDLAIRKNSSSGGLFSEIANKILSLDGVAYGAAYADDMRVIHQRVVEAEELKILRGSKYVQSDISKIYQPIKIDLKENRLVYFTGTPCQVNGIKHYTGNPKNLITSDLVCHGVPSVQMFQEQITVLDKGITSINFRDKKRTGWGYDIKLLGKEKTRRVEPLSLPYFYGFWENLTLRPSCYNCQFSTINREGDITLADYWLVKKSHPRLKTGNGVSAVIVNTQKGEDIIKRLNGNITLKESKMVFLLKGLGRLKSPVKKPENRDLIMREYAEKGFKHISNKHLTPSSKVIVREKILRFIKQLILFKYWK